MNKLSFLQYDEQNESIYENLKPGESNTFVSSHIPVAEVEAYLNRVIGSKEAGDDFKVKIILQSFIGTETWL